MPQRQAIGTARGVLLEIAAWGPADADVDLSIACMFTREMTAAGPQGGLLHLDMALDGRLTALRRDGDFKGDFLETVFIATPPNGIAARALLVIGLGAPTDWTPVTSARAVATGLREAARCGAQSAAFAPSLMDAGLDGATTSGVTPRMLQAVLDAIESQSHIAGRGLAAPLALTQWIFDVGAAHFDGAFQQFQQAFQVHTGSR